ncbi:MAG TPA: GNAT family N-acetyltransferase [Candidatus Cloacimonetes bacterium]|nr:GNAT family N-acetyltransferase [Candidatus Cloacimonadota bacterium]
MLDAFKNSYYVTAYHDGTLIAFARAITDGHYYTSIFDVIVNPQHQKNGIAKEMMKMLRAVSVKELNSIAGIRTTSSYPCLWIYKGSLSFNTLVQ